MLNVVLRFMLTALNENDPSLSIDPLVSHLRLSNRIKTLVALYIMLINQVVNKKNKNKPKGNCVI